MAKFCTSCGQEIQEGANVCSNCGTPVNGAPQNNVVTSGGAAAPAKSNGLAIAGFIVSLVSILLCCGSISLVSLILSIIGASKAKDCGGQGKGLAIAGIIISVIGILCFIFWVVLYGIYGAAIVSETSTYGY